MKSRLLITGSRTWTNAESIDAALAEYWISVSCDPEATLVHGACPKGVDKIASGIWISHSLPDEPHPADWDKHKKAAGFIRNKGMVDSGVDICYAFIRNKSKGATHCADYAQSQGIPTYRWTIND